MVACFTPCFVTFFANFFGCIELVAFGVPIVAFRIARRSLFDHGHIVTLIRRVHGTLQHTTVRLDARHDDVCLFRMEVVVLQQLVECGVCFVRCFLAGERLVALPVLTPVFFVHFVEPVVSVFGEFEFRQCVRDLDFGYQIIAI